MSIQQLIEEKEKELKRRREESIALSKKANILREIFETLLNNYTETQEINHIISFIYNTLEVRKFKFEKTYNSADLCMKNDWYNKLLQQEQYNFYDYIIENLCSCFPEGILTGEEISLIESRNNSIKDAQKFEEEIADDLITLLVSNHQVKYYFDYNIDNFQFKIDKIEFQRIKSDFKKLELEKNKDLSYLDKIIGQDVETIHTFSSNQLDLFLEPKLLSFFVYDILQEYIPDNEDELFSMVQESIKITNTKPDRPGITEKKITDFMEELF